MGVRAWFSPGDPPGSGSVSPPSRQAGGNVTVWLFFRRRGHWRGRAPWPGPHRGLAGRAEAPHARDAHAGPWAGGYGSASLPSSPRQPPIPQGRGRPTLGSRPSGGRLRGDPVVGGDCSARDDMSRRLRWASPKGAHSGWNLLRRATGTKVPPDGALTCFLTVSRLMNSSPARAWFGVPAASIASTCSSRSVSGSIRPAPPGQHFARSPAR